MRSFHCPVPVLVKLLGAASVVLLTLSCGKQNRSVSSDQAFVDESRKLTDDFQEQLKSELMQAMQSGGPGAAIEVCQVRAAHIADEARRRRDRDSWALSRTALRVRNPDNAATEWQRRGLLNLQQTIDARDKGLGQPAGGDRPVEWHEKAADGSFRYLRAIPMGALCSTCHGDPAELLPVVKQRLAQLYPKDQATGFAVGDLRGAFVVTAPPR